MADVTPTPVGQLSADGRWRWYDSPTSLTFERCDPLGHRIAVLEYLQSPSTKFPTREDAAWLVLGFVVFWGAAGILAVSMLLDGGRVASPRILPLASLVIASAVILELGLRRLQANLTGKTLSPWPRGIVSLHTISQAFLPSTMSEAADRIGLNGKVLAAFVYVLVVADLVLLAVVTG